MKPRQFLPGVGHVSRSIFFLLVALVGYGIWLSLITWLGWVESDTSKTIVGALLLAPFLPIAAFDLWLRIAWEQEVPTLFPPPPSLMARLLQREYGLYWFPALICIPLWVWAVGVLGLAGFTWLQGFV